MMGDGKLRCLLPAGAGFFLAHLALAGLPETGPLYSFAWPLVIVSLGAMVVVPLTLEVLRRHGFPVRCPVAVLLLAWGMMLIGAEREGWIWPLPWLAVTTGISAQALVALWRGARHLDRVVTLAGPVMLAVGGAWYFADRTGMAPLGFDPLIVRLTAAHFHFAGLVLPVVTGLALRHWPSGMARFAAWGVLGGVPMVAAGITLTRLGHPVEVECSLALVFSGCALVTGLLLAGNAARRGGGQRPLVRWLLGVSGVCLAAGMTLAVLYALRPWLALPWLQNMPRMWAWHGTIQAIGFSVPALAGWALWRQKGTGGTGGC